MPEGLRYNASSSRSTDGFLAPTALVIRSGWLLLVALVIRVALSTPVGFYQVGPAARGKPLPLDKCRTMTDAVMSTAWRCLTSGAVLAWAVSWPAGVWTNWPNS